MYKESRTEIIVEKQEGMLPSIRGPRDGPHKTGLVTSASILGKEKHMSDVYGIRRLENSLRRVLCAAVVVARQLAVEAAALSNNVDSS